MDQIEKLKQLAAAAARDAALPEPEDYRIHRIGKEMRALLRARFPGAEFHIATSDGFDTMGGPIPPMVEIRWSDGPAWKALSNALGTLVNERRSNGFEFELLTMHGFTCPECGETHGGTLDDKPRACPDIEW